MATTTASGNCCDKCSKLNAVLKCGGCTKDFCYNHYLEHRQELSKQLDEIQIRRDLIRLSINDKLTETEKSSLMKQIDEWEQDSIIKIKQTAEETRKILIKYINKHTNQIESKLNNLTDRIKQGREENNLIETNLIEWDKHLTQLKEELNKPSTIRISYDSIPLITRIRVNSPIPMSITNISINAKWKQDGITVAGGNGNGNELNQLCSPWGLYIDDDQTIYVADRSNHRIVAWKNGAMSGQVVAGGHGKGNRNDQLNDPVNVIIDKTNDCFIICDRGNQRIVRWPCQKGMCGETIISNVDCWGLAMDDDGSLYVSDVNMHEVRRYGMGDTIGTMVAGGKGVGNRLDQLYGPYFIFVDRDHSVYVSEWANHRVTKWTIDAKEGVVVAGGQGQGNSLIQLPNPRGVVVDQSGTVYVLDYSNTRMMRWSNGAQQGEIIICGNQFTYPCDFSLDKQNNIYVVDYKSHRVQKFNIESDP